MREDERQHISHRAVNLGLVANIFPVSYTHLTLPTN